MHTTPLLNAAQKIVSCLVNDTSITRYYALQSHRSIISDRSLFYKQLSKLWQTIIALSSFAHPERPELIYLRTKSVSDRIRCHMCFLRNTIHFLETPQFPLMRVIC